MSDENEKQVSEKIASIVLKSRDLLYIGDTRQIKDSVEAALIQFGIDNKQVKNIIKCNQRFTDQPGDWINRSVDELMDYCAGNRQLALQMVMIDNVNTIADLLAVSYESVAVIKKNPLVAGLAIDQSDIILRQCVLLEAQLTQFLGTLSGKGKPLASIAVKAYTNSIRSEIGLDQGYLR